MTERHKLEGLAPRRRRCGMTQEALAALLGVPRANVASWETGVSWPLARDLPAIAGALLCSIDELYRAPEEEERIATPVCAPVRNDGRDAEGGVPYEGGDG